MTDIGNDTSAERRKRSFSPVLRAYWEGAPRNDRSAELFARSNGKRSVLGSAERSGLERGQRGSIVGEGIPSATEPDSEGDVYVPVGRPAIAAVTAAYRRVMITASPTFESRVEGTTPSQTTPINRRLRTVTPT